MQAEELKELVAKSALSPVRVYTTDGAAYDIDHPELAYVSRSLLVIGVGVDKPLGIPARLAFCPLEQIARVATFPKAA